MNRETELLFDTSPLILSLAIAGFLAIAVVAYLGWRRSGYARGVGLLELVRTLVGLMAAITLCQPEWQETFQPTRRPVLAVLRDESRSMETRDVVDPAQPQSAVSRAAWVESQLPRLPWDRLRDRIDVVQETFASRESSDQRALGSNLDAALADTLQRHENLRAIVLVSDGDWNEGESPANTATRLRIRQIPVFAVPTGSEESLPDIEVASLEPPTFSVVGKAMQVPFSLRSTLPTDYEVEVVLEVDSGARLTRKVVVPAMGTVRDIFFWTPEKVGDVQLTLRVPEHPQELNRDNNQAVVRVAVKAESLKVLVVESYPRWEYRYLRNALDRDPGVDVSCVLLHPDNTKRGGGHGYLDRFPDSPEALGEFDVVLLGDIGIGPQQLTSENCRQLRNLVEKQASGLIFLPGLRGYQNSLLGSELQDLYPVVLDTNSPRGFGTQTPSHFVLTDEGQASLLTKLADQPRENGAVWRSLPGFQWRSPALRQTAGSEVLAIDEKSRAPVLVTKTFGTGKILFMGTDGAWRWREGVEDKYHYRFWGQVARWMAYQRQMAEGEMIRVFYTPDRPTLGNVLTLNATILDPSGAPLSAADVQGELTDPSGRRQQMRFLPNGDEGGLYTARVTPQIVGSHRLTLRCQQTSATLDVTLDVQGKQKENVGKPARVEVMREIAKITRGQVVPQDQLQTLCDQVLELPEPEPLVRRKPIWASPVWAGLLVTLLGIFWIGRKAIGAI
jgi:hypothetical protein